MRAPCRASLEEIVAKVTEDNPSHHDGLYRSQTSTDPYRSEVWLEWMAARADLGLKEQRPFYELALSYIPRSYKIWKRYLTRVAAEAFTKPVSDTVYDETAQLYRRALLNLPRLPRLWVDLLELLFHCRRVTAFRVTLDAALRALPVTLHSRVWVVAMEYLQVIGSRLPHLSRSLWRRFLELEPQHRELYVDFLCSIGDWDEAVRELAAFAVDRNFLSVRQNTRHEIWLKICSILGTSGDSLRGEDVGKLIRIGIAQFPDDCGKLWTHLAGYYASTKRLDSARAVFSEALIEVRTVRDFVIVFQGYSHLEESLLTRTIELQEKAQASGDTETAARFASATGRLVRNIERLLDQRAGLVSRLKLRRNPNDIDEWIVLAGITARDKYMTTEDTALVFAEAIRTVEPSTTGGVARLWIGFGEFYERHDDLSNAIATLNEALKSSMASAEDYSRIFCEMAELHLRHGDSRAALDVTRKALLKTDRVQGAAEERRRRGGCGHRVLSLAMDLEEHYGDNDTLKVVFRRGIDTKNITVAHVCRYADLLCERQQYEDAFSVFETAITHYRWPPLYGLWLPYLTKFVSRYGVEKVERARALFERAVSDVPAKFARRIYLLFAAFEDENGLARQALDAIARAIDVVPASEMWYIYQLLVAKTTETFGLLKTRPILQQAVDGLEKPKERISACLLFAKIEVGVGEINRARALYSHAAQFTKVEDDTEFWEAWRAFEVLHGNEESFNELVKERTRRGRRGVTFATDACATDVS